MDVEKLKQKILDLAIRGKLVPQDPNDEPASVLIEKIKAEKAKLVKEGKLKAFKEESYIYKGSDNFYYEKIGDKTICIQDEIPFEIPDSWAWCRLSDIGTTNIGLTYKPEEISDIGTIVLRSPNIKNGKIDLSDLVRVKTEIKDNQFININDILICARNGSKSLVGKCAIFDRNGIGDVSFGAFMAVFRTSLFKYAYYYFNSALFRSYFENEDNKQINQVTQNILKESFIPVPPAEEQKRLVTVLDCAFELISNIKENGNKINALTESAKNRLLDNIFGENSSYKSYYPNVLLKEVFKLENGMATSSGKLPYLEAKVIRGSKEPKIIEFGIYVKKGTKVILVDGENSGEIMTAPFDGYLGSTFKLINIKKDTINGDYLNYYILYKKQELRETKTGSAIPHLNKKLLNNYELPLPPLDVQNQTVKRIDAAFSIMAKII